MRKKKKSFIKFGLPRRGAALAPDTEKISDVSVHRI